MNALGRDIQPGERLVLKKEIMSPDYQDIKKRIFVAEVGEGMGFMMKGLRIEGHFEFNGRRSWILGREIDVNETMELQSVEVAR